MDVKLLSLSLSFCFVLFLAGGLARQAHLKHGLISRCLHFANLACVFANSVPMQVLRSSMP